MSTNLFYTYRPICKGPREAQLDATQKDNYYNTRNPDSLVPTAQTNLKVCIMLHHANILLGLHHIHFGHINLIHKVTLSEFQSVRIK